MATWNELFLNENFIVTLPQPEVHKFVRKLEGIFIDRPLSLWDFCCGAGRHAVLMAQMGHKVYGSDVAENGINHAQKWLKNNDLKAELKVSDMTNCPFNNIKFHGVVSWDALHHNIIENIRKAVSIIYDNLIDGGLFMTTLLSTKCGAYGEGNEIERNTFVRENWSEAGVPHHYFDEQEIRELFKQWKIVILVEQVYTYIETEPNYHETNPFPYTKWNIIVQK
jgi:2-polyprenyl-3-methyl-5-hydroxy-6-metoxy-1,4-benzoquinol methylase